jgi:hypothetical protein
LTREKISNILYLRIGQIKLKGEIQLYHFKNQDGNVIALFIVLIIALGIIKACYDAIYSEKPETEINKESVLTTPIEQTKETKWSLIWHGKGKNCYYDKNSINKIEENIWEVTTGCSESGNIQITRMERFNCKTKEYEIGKTYSWKNDNLINQMNFSGTWFPIQTPMDKRIFNLVCKKRKY